MKKCLAFFLFLCLAAFSAVGLAQSAAPQSAPVHRTTKAVNYRLRGDAVKIDFHGTELMQNASGEAKVTGKKSSVEIDAKFDGLDDPTKFGLEYLSLVLWAISPEGRAVNLGELVIDHNSSRVKAITDMQTFGMIVTAEPYFAVNQPGNMVVMENIVGATTVGRQENIEARYELLGRGTYSATNTKIQDAIFGIDRKTPRVLFEARNAVQNRQSGRRGQIRAVHPDQRHPATQESRRSVRPEARQEHGGNTGARNRKHRRRSPRDGGKAKGGRRSASQSRGGQEGS